MTILFGANSSGKTNVLTAIERALSGDSKSWSEDDDRLKDLEPTFFVELDCADVPDHPDGLLLERLLRGQLGEGIYSPLLGTTDEVQTLTKGMTVVEIRAAMVDELVAGFDTPAEDRAVVARWLVEASSLWVEPADTWLTLHPDDAPDEVVDAARRVVEAAPEDDHLANLSEDLLAGQYPLIDDVGGGLLSSAYTEVSETGGTHQEQWVLADVLSVDYTPTGLDEAIEGAVGAGLTALRRGAIPTAADWRFLEWEIEHPGDTGSAAVQRKWRSWIETQTIEGQRWTRLRPLATALAGVLEDRCNELLPSFVAAQGTVTIDIEPMSSWTHTSPLKVLFHDHGSDPIPLENCGAGTRRWIAAAIRLACSDLTKARWTVLGTPTGASTDDVDEALAQVEAAAEGGALLDVAQPAWPDRANDVVLVDEPEANLHPGAVASVIDWLREMSQRTSALLVATHHPAFLDLDREGTTLIHVQRRNGTTELHEVRGRTDLDAIAADAGLTRADLLQLIRMILFVEGPHDQSVLDAYIGDQLSDARVLVLPMHGTHNAMALVEAELGRALGTPMAVLIDNATGRGTAEERAIDALQREAKASGLTLQRFGIGKPDILYYLHPDACRAEAPAFPGWAEAEAAWKDAGRPTKFKPFITSTYGLKVDRRTVARLARASAAIETPKALHRLAKQITGAASAEPRGTTARAQ